jgi:hypothetical protein
MFALLVCKRQGPNALLANFILFNIAVLGKAAHFGLYVPLWLGEQMDALGYWWVYLVGCDMAASGIWAVWCTNGNDPIPHMLLLGNILFCPVTFAFYPNWNLTN